MGLFGYNAKKKLAKANEYLAEGKHFDARQAFEEILEKAKSDQASERTEAEAGARIARERMVEERVREARAHLSIGERDAAKNRLTTALDIAGDDIDTTAIRATLNEANDEGPRQASLRPQESKDSDVVSAPLGGGIADLIDRDELLASDPLGTYAFYISDLSDELASLFRSQPESFQLGYVSLRAGAPDLALDYFKQSNWSPSPQDPILFERAHAHQMVGEGMESLEWLDRMQAGPSPEGLQLRSAALLNLERFDDAIEVARQLVSLLEEPHPVADETLARGLLAAGQAQDAWNALDPWIEEGLSEESFLTLGSTCLSSLDRDREAAALLESLIHQRLNLSLQSEEVPDFPILAGRMLLNLYVGKDFPTDPQLLETLLLHLLDFDSGNAETYRGLLVR